MSNLVSCVQNLLDCLATCVFCFAKAQWHFVLYLYVYPPIWSTHPYFPISNIETRGLSYSICFINFHPTLTQHRTTHVMASYIVCMTSERLTFGTVVNWLINVDILRCPFNGGYYCCAPTLARHSLHLCLYDSQEFPNIETINELPPQGNIISWVVAEQSSLWWSLLPQLGSVPPAQAKSPW